MAVNNFSLYLADGVTPIAIPKPNWAEWATIKRQPYPSGLERISLYKQVSWRFDRLSAADYQKFVQYRLNGRQTFETWKRPEGAVQGQFVVCTGILSETVSGRRNIHGEYRSVTVNWTMVLQS
jgi:hypothetical protein